MLLAILIACWMTAKPTLAMASVRRLFVQDAGKKLRAFDFPLMESIAA
jgi:hypothetical protein